MLPTLQYYKCAWLRFLDGRYIRRKLKKSTPVLRFVVGCCFLATEARTSYRNARRPSRFHTVKFCLGNACSRFQPESSGHKLLQTLITRHRAKQAFLLQLMMRPCFFSCSSLFKSLTITPNANRSMQCQARQLLEFQYVIDALLSIQHNAWWQYTTLAQTTNTTPSSPARCPLLLTIRTNAHYDQS